MPSLFSKVSNQSNTHQESIQDPNNLTGPELDFLLRTLKTCTITGDQVETFYNVVIKLQNQYVNQTK
jgi:hypothetical protein